MAIKKIRILNFDDSVISQKNLIGAYSPEIIDLKDAAQSSRLYMGRAAMRHLEKRISALADGSINFLGSGDFHHITHLLQSQYNEPISVIDFDFHPDWDRFLPALHCGSWVTWSMKNKNILKCVILGASPSEKSLFSLTTADLGSLKDDRIEIYPYFHRPAKAYLRKVPDNISIRKEARTFFTKIYWSELKGKDLYEFMARICNRLASKKVYITIDKDCMRPEDALTNWNQGEMPVYDLLSALKVIKENTEIVGMDISGEYSKPESNSFIKNFALKFGHPKKITADSFSPTNIAAINERTNLSILKTVL